MQLHSSSSNCKILQNVQNMFDLCPHAAPVCTRVPVTTANLKDEATEVEVY